MSPTKKVSTGPIPKEKNGWRLCPVNQYWRSAHKQSTYTRKDGTTVREHNVRAGCCENPSRKDQIYSEELRKIEAKYFSKSESGFRPKLSTKDGDGNGYARGLLQVTDGTRRVLGDPKGELKDHLVHVSKSELGDPGFNLAAGIRWLFHKKDLARGRLGREATWDEAVAEYKGYLKKTIKNPKVTPRGMRIFRGYLEKLRTK